MGFPRLPAREVRRPVVKGYGYFTGETTGLLRRFGCEVRILVGRKPFPSPPVPWPAINGRNSPRRVARGQIEVWSVVKFTVTSWRACSLGRGSSPQPCPLFPDCVGAVRTLPLVLLG